MTSKRTKKPIEWKQGDLCISGTDRDRQICVFYFAEGQWGNTIRLGDPMPEGRSPHHDSSMLADLRRPTLAELRVHADLVMQRLSEVERTRARLDAELAGRLKT